MINYGEYAGICALSEGIEYSEDLQKEWNALQLTASSEATVSYTPLLCEHEDAIICHSGCDDMADVARYYLEESGQLGELPAHLQNYIDYAAYGRDMELEGRCV